MFSVKPHAAEAERLIQSGRIPEALQIIEPLAARGDADALYLLGGVRWAGMGGRADPALGRALFARAEQAGHRQAGIFHTNLLAAGIAGLRDWSAALARLGEEAGQDPARRHAHELVSRMRLTAQGDPIELPNAERLSVSPDVRLFRGLLTAAECDYLRKVAEPLYQPSIVNDGRGFMIRDPIRTSDGATLHWLIEDPALHALNRRLAAASGSRAGQGEAFQILRYRPGQEYRPHLDAARITDNPRVLTVLVWLNEDYQGGETSFVESGLAVKGAIGDALVFRNLLADDRTPDFASRHAGLPVASGVKYLASRWIRRDRWAP